jgi:serine/threonine protein kinase
LKQVKIGRDSNSSVGFPFCRFYLVGVENEAVDNQPSDYRTYRFQIDVFQQFTATRSDVYSLGVLLYELLTDTTPFDGDRFRKAAFDEIRRIIREEEPPRPSTRLTSLGATLTAVSAKRGTDPARLPGLVRGELDWIVMKRLEKDRSRRYETVIRTSSGPTASLVVAPVGARALQPALPAGYTRPGRARAPGWPT